MVYLRVGTLLFLKIRVPLMRRTIEFGLYFRLKRRYYEKVYQVEMARNESQSD